jgi:hypothetical protein
MQEAEVGPFIAQAKLLAQEAQAAEVLEVLDTLRRRQVVEPQILVVAVAQDRAAQTCPL